MGLRCAAVVVLLCAACGSSDPPRRLLLVSVDTLRADHLGAYGGPPGLTPHLDALAAESVLFERVFAPAPFTLPSVGALLTGLYPDESGLVGNFFQLADDVPTLATLLAERGFATAAVVSNPVLRAAAGLGRGFGVYDDTLDGRDPLRGLPERDAERTTAAALAALDDLLDRADGALFLWVHYQDPHGPYTPPAGYREAHLDAERARDDGRRKLSLRPAGTATGGIPDYQYVPGADEVAFYRAGYAGEVSYVDQQIGRLLAGVEARGLGDALVAFTADHGEGLGGRDYWFDHGEQLTDPHVRVPLLLRIPGRSAERRTELASLVDLAPTLLAALDVSAPATSGRDLLGRLPSLPWHAVLLRGAAPSDRVGVVSGGHKLIATPSEGGLREELYREGAEAGPDDLVDEAALRGWWMRRRLSSLVAKQAFRTPRRQSDLSEEERIQLRALGYAPAPASE